MISATPDRPWTLEPEDVARALATDPTTGLSDAEAADRLGRIGRNEIVERARRPPSHSILGDGLW